MVKYIICKKCNREKPHGARDLCKTCNNMEWKKTPKGQECERRYLTSKKGKATKRKSLRKYNHSEHGKKKRKEYKQSESGKKSDSESQKRRRKNPEEQLKHRVRETTNNRYPKKGFCQKCKTEGKTDYHHFHYKPNIFMEVCKPCHNEYDNFKRVN